ncbi:MAG: hypothetical protein ACD_39C00606G0001 [uncultured bacterium]|nr:MAG: hypothetical protein ACD_39C00606G0001 [uncultured bacterium]
MKGTRLVLYILLVTFTALCNQAQAWDQHFVFTQVAATELTDRMPVLIEKVKTERLETFLQQNEAAVKALFRDFYTWKHKVYKYQHWQLSTDNYSYLYTGTKGQMDKKRFLELLGVQPTGLSQIVVSDVFASQYNIAEVNDNTQLPFSTWLTLFSDEPDWGADIGLFGKGDPRYSAEIPYGSIDKLSSQAPFHMYFPSERVITYAASKSIKESMALLRFNVFVRLARLAWGVKNYFWTARFLGNAMHYLQDVANPYHSSALPYANIITYIKYFAVKNKDKFLSDNMQILANRHFAYEALGLEFMILTKDNLDSYIRISKVIDRGYQLGTADGSNDYCAFLSEIFNRVSKSAYKTSRALDKLIAKNFPAHLIKDPKFDPQTRDDFQLSVWFNQELLNNYLQNPKTKQGDLIKAYIIDAVRTFECSALLMGYILR